MRDLIVTENTTVDGVIDLAGGWFLPPGHDRAADRSDMEAALREQREASGGLLLGRVTFEHFRAHWPNVTDDATGVADHLDRVDKHVVSSTLGDPGWANTTVHPGPVADTVRALKEAPGGPVVCTGSITLVHALVAAGLVDEYRLFTYPVVLGRGRRLFEDATAVPPLRLVESRAFTSGVVLLRYRVG